MPREPERLDVACADFLDDRRDDVLQILIVGLRPRARRRVRRRDDEPVLVDVVENREVVPLPVSPRAPAVQAEDDGNFLIRFQIAWVIEKVCPACLHLDDLAGVHHAIAKAVLVGTVQHGGPDTCRSGELREHRPLGAGARGRGDRGVDHQPRDPSPCRSHGGARIGYCRLAVNVPSPSPPRFTLPFIESLPSMVPE